MPLAPVGFNSITQSRNRRSQLKTGYVIWPADHNTTWSGVRPAVKLTVKQQQHTAGGPWTGHRDAARRTLAQRNRSPLAVNPLLRLSSSSLLHIQLSQLCPGAVALYQRDGRLEDGHGSAEHHQRPHQTESEQGRPLGEVEEVQHRVEQLVTAAHEEQHRPRGVVEPQQRRALAANGLVAGAAAQGGHVQVDPVAGDVDGHAQLEPEHVLRVEGAQAGQQAHGGAAVRQLVQHGAEPAALAQQARRVAVERVQQAADDIAGGGGRVPLGHEVQREQRQQHARVADQVRHKQEHVLHGVAMAITAATAEMVGEMMFNCDMNVVQMLVVKQRLLLTYHTSHDNMHIL